MAYAYAYTNLLNGLAAGAFTMSAGLADATRSRMNDGRMDKRTTTSAAASGMNIIIDLGAAVAMNGWAVLNSNIAMAVGSGATDVTLKIEGADNSGMSTNLVTAKAASTLNRTPPKNKDHVLQFPTVTKRHWRLTWAWTGGGSIANPSIGELFAFYGQTQFTRKSIYGGGEREDIITAKTESDNGNTNAYFKGGPIRSKRLPFQDLTLTQREELGTMWRSVNGEATPLLWIESYEASAGAAAAAEQEVIYGRLQVAAYEWSEVDYALYSPNEWLIRSLGREIGS